MDLCCIYLFLITDTEGYEYRYIEDTLEQDRAKFKPVPVVNPFLTDFVDETAGGAGGGGNGATQARAVSAIGSMQGILVAL